jgi:hypothetical protein
MNRHAGALLAALCAVGNAATAAPGLTRDNYVDVGDTIVDMLDASAFAFSSLALGQIGPPRAMRVSFANPSFHTQPFSATCPGGGTVKGSIADRDASGDLSVQDRFVTVFDACRIGAETITGSSEFVIAAHRIDGNVETTELAFRFHRLGSDAMRWTGPARAVLTSDAQTGAEHCAITYERLTVARGARNYRWSFTLSVRRTPMADRTAQIAGAMTVEHDLLQLHQDDPFVIAAGGRARAGQLTATDADGDRLEVEAAPYRYRYRYFAHDHRGEAPDSSSQSRPHQRY